MLKIDTLLREKEVSLLKKIKKYREVAQEIKTFLDKHPHEWGRFQSEFNQEVNGIFREIMDFEKERLSKGDEESVYKLKRLFMNRLRKDFLHGEYIRWSLEKPYGYAGDFRIIDMIYLNQPKTAGFDRLYDNYFQNSAASVATRNRKEDFKRIIKQFVTNSGKESSIQIMDLASGPCRDLKEIWEENRPIFVKAVFDCYDSDEQAIAHAKSLMAGFENVNYFKQNVVRLALLRNIEKVFHKKYDLIFSTGLFDYLDERIAVRLISNLKQILLPSGVVVISNYTEKYGNPSLHFMECVGDWNLIYRTKEEFLKIFIDSGFTSSNLNLEYEQQGIMQYCFAQNGS